MAEDVAFNIAVFALTNVGQVRAGNEDSFLVLNLSTADTWTPNTVKEDPAEHLTTFSQSHFGSLLAVSDGMGGALAGEVASRLGVECVRDRMLELQASPSYSKFPFHERLRLSIELANLYIYQMSMKKPEYAGMGATFTAAGLCGTTVYFAQVGDSRAYVIRGGQVQQMTRDQSLVGQLVQSGHITEEEAERHSYKNVILQALGASPKINVAVDKLNLRDMDILVLCSDGLSNKMRAEEIRQVIEESPSLKEACETLIKLANERGGEDNITVLVSQFTGNQLPRPEPAPAGASPPAETETLPLTSGAYQIPNNRWGAETIPRDPNLPEEVDPDELDLEEDTLRPDEQETQEMSRATKELDNDK